MYLSRIELNARLRETMRALASPHILHAAVEQSFPRSTDGAKQHILWRVDWMGAACYLLVMSQNKPDFTHIVQQFGWAAADQQWETKDYDPLIKRLQKGQSWQFRLCANPVHSVKQSEGRGKVLAHVTKTQQKSWLAERAQKHGFLLEDSKFDVVHSEWKKFRKMSGMEVSLRTAVFEGVLTVTDAEAFAYAMVHGMGRAKAYGCGLLTVMRAEGK